MGTRTRDIEHPRAYLPRGDRVHLLAVGESLNSGARALCGVAPALYSSWYGSGNWDEIQKLADLALCLACERVVRRPRKKAS